MTIKILMIDDEEDQRRQIKEILEEDTFPNEKIIVETKEFFNPDDLSSIEEAEYDILILDLFDKEKKEYLGEPILKSIQQKVFIPVIFYTGFASEIKESQSEVIKIVPKTNGYEGIKNAIDEIINSKIPLIKKRISLYLKDKFKEYMWDVVHKDWEKIKPYLDDNSSSYLLTKRLTHALSERYILDEASTNFSEKKHPLEMYVYPPLSKEINLGDIIQKDEKNYLVLTPSCDFVLRGNGCRKAENVLLVEIIPLKDFEAYKEYKKDGNKKEEVKFLIENRKGDRYYFLPETWFLDNSLIDFQKTNHITFEELTEFQKLSEIDSLHINSILSTFIRYYNRVGTKDLDSGKILDKL
jgi:CheY-like chemotaxis protein